MSYTLEAKTGKYIDTPLTNFPVSEDVWNRMMDVTSSLMPLVTQYNEHFKQGNVTACMRRSSTGCAMQSSPCRDIS